SLANGGTNATTAQAAINNISGLTTSGDLLTHNGTNAIRLSRGTEGQCLTSGATELTWADCGSESEQPGETWTARTSAEGNQWYSITYGNGLFVAVAPSGTNRVMTSPDGITWIPRTTPEANSWRSVT